MRSSPLELAEVIDTDILTQNQVCIIQQIADKNATDSADFTDLQSVKSVKSVASFLGLSSGGRPKKRPQSIRRL